MRPKNWVFLFLVIITACCRHHPENVIVENDIPPGGYLFYPPSPEDLPLMQAAVKNGKDWFFTLDRGSFYKRLKPGESLWIINDVGKDEYRSEEKNWSGKTGWKIIGMSPGNDIPSYDGGDTLRIKGGYACQTDALTIY